MIQLFDCMAVHEKLQPMCHPALKMTFVKAGVTTELPVWLIVTFSPILLHSQLQLGSCKGVKSEIELNQLNSSNCFLESLDEMEKNTEDKRAENNTGCSVVKTRYPPCVGLLID